MACFPSSVFRNKVQDCLESCRKHALLDITVFNKLFLRICIWIGPREIGFLDFIVYTNKEWVAELNSSSFGQSNFIYLFYTGVMISTILRYLSRHCIFSDYKIWIQFVKKTSIAFDKWDFMPKCVRKNTFVDWVFIFLI